MSKTAKTREIAVVTQNTRNGVYVRESEIHHIVPALPAEPIHIFRGGTCGYKLSVGQRGLNLAELAAIVQLVNRRIARS